jgi:hypothetical protein
MEQEVKELIKIAEQAQDGYWMPFLIFASLCTMIISLVLIIGRMILKKNDSDHSDMIKLIKMQDKRLSTSEENQQALSNIITRHDVEIEHLKKPA